MNGAPSVRVKVAAGVVTVVMLLVLAEASLALLPGIAGNSLRGILYFPPEITREQYERYLAVRDPIVGWPRRDGRDPGPPVPRPSPAFPDGAEWCVTLYGESFTYGDEVSDAEAWGNVLAQRLGCRVGNFGVGGHGTDQALLTFIANPADRAPVAIVGIFADNLLRNVNQYRYFLTGGETLALKPRFVLENGVLNPVPIPGFSYEQFVDGLRNPRAIFPHEVFLPGSRHGPVIWSFPYTLSLLNLVRTDHVTNFVRGRPSWINFYRLDHDSRALPTTVAIVEQFRLRAAPGKTVVAILYPSGASYKLARKTGEFALRALASELEAHGIPARDLTADFSAYLGERSFCELLTSVSACSGHYNEEGNQVVAGAVQAFLAANRPPGLGKQ
ncbi:MAG TPA: hypothetical protein VJT81_12595 [Burkholderiales bacterium]|nr:hypothetical protein [Burkholderiales bacterium]